MFRFSQSRRLPYPADTVWRHLIDFPNVPTWESGVREVRQVTPGPPVVGTELVARRVYGGRESVVQCRITDWSEGRAVTMAIEGGPVRGASICYAVVPDGADRSLVTYTAEGELRGPIAILTPLVAYAGRMQIASNLVNLERRIASDNARATP